MLVVISAKNAILIVEFAKGEFDKGRALVDAALEGRQASLPAGAHDFVRVHLRSSAALERRRRRRGFEADLGTAVIAGMLAATAFAIFIIPMLFVLIERRAEGGATRSGCCRPAQTEVAAGAVPAAPYGPSERSQPKHLARSPR